MRKEPKFFCDNCGAEVDRNLRACPGCGRFFASVRCPQCGFSGEEKLFSSGCPSCGYSAPPGRAFSRPEGGRKKSTQFFIGPLPLWVYIFCALAVLGAVISLLLLLR